MLPAAAVNATPELALGAVFNGGKHHPGRGGHVVVTELLITLSQVGPCIRCVLSACVEGRCTTRAGAATWR